MKKILFLILLSFVPLFASSHFWQSLVEVEEKFFNKEIILKIINENNETAPIDENQTTDNMDEKFNLYEGLVISFKNEPYALDKNVTIFYNPKESKKEINQLSLRIESNRKYGYIQAVNRDKIALQTLRLKKQIYHFFLYLADNWTQLEQKSLIEYISKHRETLKKIPLKDTISLYKEVAERKGSISQQIQEKFFDFAKQYYFFDSFLDYLTLNAKLLTYRSIANELQLDNLINYINKQPLAAKANVMLRYIKTDVGRLILFVGIILFFLLLNLLIYKRLYHYFKGRILRVEDEIDDILIDNLNRIRRPIFLLVNGIGVELALEVLQYPQPLSEKTTLFFYLFFVAVIAYILMRLVENIFFAYFHTQTSKQVPLRAELLNLMLSVAKVLIFIIASIVVLVKMGVNITGLVASLGIGGLAVALAAQSTLSNFFGLLKIIFDESFSQGDWIETKDIEGTVVETGFISTKVRTFDNALITVPNAELANTPLKNWSRRTIGRRIKMRIGVTYHARRKNLKKAIEEIDAMLKNHPEIVTPEKIDHKSLRKRYKSEGKFLSTDDKFGIKTTQLVFFDRFSDSSVDILIYAFSKSTDWTKWLEVKEDVLYKIWEILEKNALEFAFPSQSLYIEEIKQKGVDPFEAS
jgi:MscS family membrane protein